MADRVEDQEWFQLDSRFGELKKRYDVGIKHGLSSYLLRAIEAEILRFEDLRMQGPRKLHYCGSQYLDDLEAALKRASL